MIQAMRDRLAALLSRPIHEHWALVVFFVGVAEIALLVSPILFIQDHWREPDGRIVGRQPLREVVLPLALLGLATLAIERPAALRARPRSERDAKDARQLRDDA